MKNLPSQTKPLTFEATWALLQETDRILTEKFAETDRQMKETDRLFKETRQRQEETRQRQEETDRQMKETDRQIKALNKQIGGMANSNGDVAESYFINSFKKYPQFAGQNFDNIDVNLQRKNNRLNLQAEYDIVMYNCSSVAIIEIKYKANKDDVEELVKKVDSFKLLFPQYKDFAIYLGLAGLSVNKKIEKEAIRQGIGVIKQVGKNMVINDTHLKAF